jgi:hypothetical protein
MARRVNRFASRELPLAALRCGGCDCHAPAIVVQSPRRISEAERSATDVRLPRTRPQLFHPVGDLRSSNPSRAADQTARRATVRMIGRSALASNGETVVGGQDYDLDPVVGGDEVVEIPKCGQVRIGRVRVNDPATPEDIVRK